MGPTRVVLVFAKPPRPGHVKTRLLQLLTAQQAAELHLVCLRDTLRMAGHAGECRKWLLVAGRPDSAQRLAEQLRLTSRWRLTVQVGGDLGNRLAFAFEQCFLSGARKVLAVGTDTPWMGAERLLRALAMLDSADAVLGPTEDGGYYLVAARRMIPEMFQGIPWGTSRVLTATLEALARVGASHRLLPRDFDLDRPADLHRAAHLLRRKPFRAPLLARWLELNG